MAFYRCGGGGIPSSLKTDMNAVFNKKFGTSADYPPADWPDTVNLMGPLPEGTATGSIAHITDGADEVPLKSWEVEIAPTLTGKSAIECMACGNNLFDKTTATIGKYINVNGQEATNEIKAHSVLLPLKPSTSYYMSGYAYGSYYSILALDKDMNVLSTWYGGASKTEPFVATTPNNARWCYLNFNADQIDTVIFAESATAISYEAYNGTTSTVNLGRTIYGGTADVVKGEGTSLYAKLSLAVADMDNSEAYPGWRTSGVRAIVGGGINKSIIDGYTTVGPYYSINTNGATNDIIFLPPARYNNMSQTDWKTTYPDLIIDFLIELQTADTFTFTPITPTPETALGVNNFWADSGDTEVTYRADINLALGGQ